MESNRTKCEFCPEGHENDAGGYYAQLRCERNHWLKVLETATDPKVIERAERAYGRACYTGD